MAVQGSNVEAGTGRGLRAAPLTAERFAPFGEVIQAEGGRTSLVNDGRALRHDGLARLGHGTGRDLPTLAVYRVLPTELPVAVRVFERHPSSSQVFLPLQSHAFLVAVAPPTATGGPDLDRVAAFVAEGPVGLHYRADVWHVPMTALGREAVFAMLMWETGADDTVEHRLAQPLIIHA